MCPERRMLICMRLGAKNMSIEWEASLVVTCELLGNPTLNRTAQQRRRFALLLGALPACRAPAAG